MKLKSSASPDLLPCRRPRPPCHSPHPTPPSLHSGCLAPGLSRSLSQILRTLDIQVVLTGLEVWTEKDRSRITQDANATLWAFLQWRRGLWTTRPHDSTQLLTWVPSDTHGLRVVLIPSSTQSRPCSTILRGRTFQGTTVGLAPVEGMCHAESSGGVSTVSSAGDLGGEGFGQGVWSSVKVDFPGPLGTPHRHCSHHGSRDRTQPGPPP